MIKKFIFIALAVFGFSSIADTHEVDHMSDMMMSGSGEESGLMGSVWLKYKLNGNENNENENLSYRARLGWHGDVNDDIHWGVGLSSDWEQNFQSPGLVQVNLEQAYVSYSPVETISITAGKKAWRSKFHKAGILYDERLYPAGVSLKYHQGEEEGTSGYAKVGLYWLGLGEGADKVLYNKPLIAGETLKAKVGGKFALSEDMRLGVSGAVFYDGLFNSGEETPPAKEEGEQQGTQGTPKKQDPQTLVQVGVNLSTSGMMAAPAGLFGVYTTNIQDMKPSWTGGVYVGNASSVSPGEMGDWGLAVSYYDLKEGGYVEGLANRDYAAAAGSGVAARAQYNLWNNTNLVAKYTRDMKTNKNNFVGELTFHF